MIALLLDSSNANLSVGLAKDHVLVDFVHYEAWQRQSELMVNEIKNLLKRNHLTREDLDEIVSARGPGSYTGVRIALTIAKVMSSALGIPLYLVSSLEAMKDGAKPSVCVTNARSKRSYVAVYEGDKVIIPDTIWTNDEVKAYLADHPEFVLCGEGTHLGYELPERNPLLVLKDCDDAAHRCLNPLGAKPVYLKDNG